MFQKCQANARGCKECSKGDNHEGRGAGLRASGSIYQRHGEDETVSSGSMVMTI